MSKIHIKYLHKYYAFLQVIHITLLYKYFFFFFLNLIIFLTW